MASTAPGVVPKKRSPVGVILLVVALLLCAFGAWQWYTDDEQSDLNKLAAEVRAPDTRYYIRRYAIRFGLAILAFVAAYGRWKRSMSP